jgi:hypothetical protein
MALHSNVLEKEQEPWGSKFNGQAAVRLQQDLDNAKAALDVGRCKVVA